MKFRDQLRKKLQNEIPDELITLLPSGLQFISTVAILNLKDQLIPYKKVIGNAAKNLLPKATAVWIRTGTISGKFRKPKGLELIVGESNTEVIHTENKIRYKFDFTKIMFAKGNITERRYLPKLIKEGEIIVDMFAGIGYFSLGIAKYAKPKQIYSIELNPISYGYLKENIHLNKLSEKITPIQGDCAEETVKLSKKGVKADRIIMGVFPAPYQYISSALTLVKPNKLVINTSLETFLEHTEKKSHYDVNANLNTKKNTIIHFEGVVMGRDFTDFYRQLEKPVHQAGFDCSIIAARFVKSFGPKMWHLVLDLVVGLKSGC